MARPAQSTPHREPDDVQRQLISLVQALTVCSSWDEYQGPNDLWRWLDQPVLTAMALRRAYALDGAIEPIRAIDPEG